MTRHAGWILLSALFFVGAVGSVSAQQMLRATDVEALEQLATEFSDRYEREHAIAVGWAAGRGIPLRQVTQDGRETT